MKFKFFAVFLLLIVCFTFIVPFASADQIDKDGYLFECLNLVYVPGATGTSAYYWNNSGEDFYSVTFPSSSLNSLAVNYPLPNVTRLYFTFAKGGVNIDLPSVNATWRFSSSNVSTRDIVWSTNFNPWKDKLVTYFLICTNYNDENLGSMFSFNGQTLNSMNNFITSRFTFYQGDGWIDYSASSSIGDFVISQGESPIASYNSNSDVSVENLNGQFLTLIVWQGVPTLTNILRATSSYDTGVNILGFYSFIETSDRNAFNEGYNTGFANGQSSGYDTGYEEGREEGYDSGYFAGYDYASEYLQTQVDEDSASYSAGYDTGYDEGLDYAYEHVNESSASYIQGKYDGVESANKYTFLGLISAIIDAPIRAVFGYTSVENGVEIQHGGLLTFEVFGVDMSNFVLSIFSIAVVLCIIRVIRGG